MTGISKTKVTRALGTIPSQVQKRAPMQKLRDAANKDLDQEIRALRAKRIFGEPLIRQLCERAEKGDRLAISAAVNAARFIQNQISSVSGIQS